MHSGDAATPFLGHKALRGPPAKSVRLDLRARKGRKGPLARKGVQVIAVNPVLRVRKGRSGRKDPKVDWARKDQPALAANAAMLDRKVPRARPVLSGPPGPKGDPGASPPIRVVTGTDTVGCADNELLVSVVCATGTTEGTKCATPGAAVTGLCMRK